MATRDRTLEQMQDLGRANACVHAAIGAAHAILTEAIKNVDTDAMRDAGPDEFGGRPNRAREALEAVRRDVERRLYDAVGDLADWYPEAPPAP